MERPDPISLRPTPSLNRTRSSPEFRSTRSSSFSKSVPIASPVRRCVTLRRSLSSAFTLFEVLISTTLVGLVLTASMTSLIFIARAQISINDYAEMNSKARSFLGYLGRDLRATSSVTNFTTTNLIIVVPTDAVGGTATVSYTFVPSSGIVIRTQGGVSVTMLHHVESFVFAYFNRLSVSTSVLAELKQVRVNFTLTGSSGVGRLSQEVISAQYVLRASNV